MHLLIFSCEDHHYALPLERVVRVIRALEITPLPESSPILCGVFDLHGETLPVVSLRSLLLLKEKKMELEDALIIVRLRSAPIALLCDHVHGVFDLEKEESAESSELFGTLLKTHLVRWEERLVSLLEIDALIGREVVRGGWSHEEGTRDENG